MGAMDAQAWNERYAASESPYPPLCCDRDLCACSCGGMGGRGDWVDWVDLVNLVYLINIVCAGMTMLTMLTMCL